MTKQEINEAVAKVDGWKESKFSLKHSKVWYARSEDYLVYVLPPYTDSYDTIIPVIQAQDVPTRTRLVVSITMAQNNVAKCFGYIDATPLQLCIALLKATNNFKE